MAFPTTDFPTALDAAQGRIDGADTVFDDDFNYQDGQIRQLQTYLGINAALIGEGIAAGGPGGMVSPVASGGVAFTLAARAAFAAGDLLQLGDNFDAAFLPKFSVDADGLIWAEAGLELEAAGELFIPSYAGVPVGHAARRLFWDTVTEMLYFDDGAVHQIIGASAGSYLDWAGAYSYTEALVPVEEVMGAGVFDGSLVKSSSLFFRAVLEPALTLGTCSILLYDMGPSGGPMGAPRLVATLSTGANGLQYLEQALTVVTVGPGANQILNTARLYEVVVTSAAQVADTVVVHSAGMEVR